MHGAKSVKPGFLSKSIRHSFLYPTWVGKGRGVMFSFFPKERRIRRAQGSQFSSTSTTKERRKPRIVFDNTRRVTGDTHDDDASRVESEDGEQEDEDEDEDSQSDEMAPLLPIFEASRLGLCNCPIGIVTNRCRCFTCLQSDSCHSITRGATMRDHPHMGSTS